MVMFKWIRYSRRRNFEVVEFRGDGISRWNVEVVELGKTIFPEGDEVWNEAVGEMDGILVIGVIFVLGARCIV